MAPLRGRALKGRRLHSKAPHGHWNTTSMISAIRAFNVSMFVYMTIKY